MTGSGVNQVTSGAKLDPRCVDLVNNGDAPRVMATLAIALTTAVSAVLLGGCASSSTRDEDSYTYGQHRGGTSQVQSLFTGTNAEQACAADLDLMLSLSTREHLNYDDAMQGCVDVLERR